MRGYQQQKPTKESNAGFGADADHWCRDGSDGEICEKAETQKLFYWQR
jgi:hypothetical protein